jgi:hypothetical protein
VPKPVIEYRPKEIPKVILQPQEVIVEVPATLRHERPVEVPVTQVAELIRQVPKPEIQYVDKQVPKIITEAREQIVQVPQVFYEERLVEQPQVQIAEIVKEVPVQQVQEVPKHIPKIVETKVIEKIVHVPATLIQEKVVEVPQIIHQEVVTQKASGNVQQRIIQTGYQYDRFVSREEVVTREEEAVNVGTYEAHVSQVREFPVPSSDVEISRVITEPMVSGEPPVVTTVNLPVEPSPVNRSGFIVEPQVGTSGLVGYPGQQVVQTVVQPSPHMVTTQPLVSPFGPGTSTSVVMPSGTVMQPQPIGIGTMPPQQVVPMLPQQRRPGAYTVVGGPPPGAPMQAPTGTVYLQR